MANAHNGFVGSSGVQEHSAGDHYPVLSYCIGSADYRVAEFCGVRRDSTNASDHADHLRRMKRAEQITDAIFADRSGGSAWIDCVSLDDGGYCVAIAGHETKFKCDGLSYKAVYADVVEKLEFIDSDDFSVRTVRDVCVGWWENEGFVFIDISLHYAARNTALARAKSEGQIAIFDRSAGEDIAVECDRDGCDDLKASRFSAFRVGCSLSAGHVDSFDSVICTVCAVSLPHAKVVAYAAIKQNGGNPASYECDSVDRIAGYAVYAEKAGCLHFEDLTF